MPQDVANCFENLLTLQKQAIFDLPKKDRILHGTPENGLYYTTCEVCAKQNTETVVEADLLAYCSVCWSKQQASLPVVV